MAHHLFISFSYKCPFLQSSSLYSFSFSSYVSVHNFLKCDFFPIFPLHEDSVIRSIVLFFYTVGSPSITKILQIVKVEYIFSIYTFFSMAPFIMMMEAIMMKMEMFL